MTDSLYVSFDGCNFRKIASPYVDAYPNDADKFPIQGGQGNCLHDPGLIYKDGRLWTMSGFSDKINDLTEQPKNSTFVPMWGYSDENFMNWSKPGSGSADEDNVHVDSNIGWYPYNVLGERTNRDFDCVAPDPFMDNNGTVWVVVSMGFYGQWHTGYGSWDDVMKPYLIRIPYLAPGENAPVVKNFWNQVGKYELAVPINLPSLSSFPQALSDEREKARRDKPGKLITEDRIDGSLYQEGEKFYLVVKRYGTTNEIWSIDNLMDVSNESKWTCVNSDFVTGFEGPCLTKYHGLYYVYTDKLADYPPGRADGKTGIHMTCATSLAPNQLWKENKKVALYDQAGKLCEGRHGTVRTITDSNAIAIIMRMYRNAGYTYNPNVDKPAAFEQNGWFRSNGRRYYLENGVRLAGREWRDPATGEWYWFDSDGSMARNKEVFISFNADRTEGKWVYYDDAGHMVKGESFHGEQWNYYDIGTNKYWYYYDPITGEKTVGFVNLPQDDDPDGKWVYYDENGEESDKGKMVYGEQCINGNWYRFDEITGKMVHGEYCDNRGNWYYYETGIMHHGWTTLPDGRTYYYDEVTGIRQG